MIKALALLRVSTTQQSVERQKQELEAFTSSKGFKSNEVYYLSKEGASAYKVDDDYLELKNKMYDFLLSNPSCKTVFAWHVNRLGREEQQLHEIRNFFVSHGIQLYIQEPSLYLLNPDGSENGGMALAFSLFATTARLQIQELKAKAHDSKMLNKEKGKFNGGVAKFGYYVNKDGYYQIKEDEASIIRNIYNMYVTENASPTTISAKLNEFGFEITPQRINKILADEAYTGKYNDRPYPIIIDKELFSKVREVAKSKDSCVNKSKKYYFGSQLLVCKECGHFMTPYKSMGYACSQHYSVLKACNNTSTVSINAVETILSIKAKEKYSVVAIKEEKEMKKRLTKENKELQQRIDVLDVKIGKFGEEFDKIGVLYRKGIIKNEEELDKEIADVNMRLKELENQKAMLINQMNSNIEFINNFDGSNLNYGELFRNAWNTKDNLNYKDCYDFVHSMIDKVYVSNDEDDGELIKVFEIYYKDGTKEKVCFYSMRAKGKKKIFGLWDDKENVWIEEDYSEQWIKRV